MITPSFGLTATERVLPKLALDFTTASLDSRVTFTRATGASNPATYIDSNGYVTATSDNQPRFDHNPITLACKGLLIEESRTNLLKHSDAFGNAIWGKSAAASAVANAVAATSGNPAAGIPLVPGAVEILRFTSEAYFSAKASENTTLYITPGTGP
jgi:hypothetical protein